MSEVRKLAVEDETLMKPMAKPRRVNHYMQRAQVQHRYETDSSELVPAPKKPERLDVELADAEKTQIVSKEETVTYEADKRKPLKFKGTIVVSDILDEDPEVSTETVVEEHDNDGEVISEEKRVAADDKTTKANQILSFTEKLAAADREEVAAHEREKEQGAQPSQRHTANRKQPSAAATNVKKVPIASSQKESARASTYKVAPKRPPQQRAGVIGMTRAGAMVPAASVANQAIFPEENAVTTAQTPPLVVILESSPVPIAVHLALIGAAVVCTLTVLGIEQQIVTEGNTINREIRFSFERIIDQIGQLQTALFAHVLGSS